MFSYVFHDAKFREETHWSERCVPSRVFSNRTWNIQLQVYDQTAWQAGKIPFAIYMFVVKSFWFDYGLSHPTSFNNFHIAFDFHSRAENEAVSISSAKRQSGLLDSLLKDSPSSFEPGMFQALSENMEHFSDKQRLTLSRQRDSEKPMRDVDFHFVCGWKPREVHQEAGGVTPPQREKAV